MGLIYRVQVAVADGEVGMATKVTVAVEDDLDGAGMTRRCGSRDEDTSIASRATTLLRALDGIGESERWNYYGPFGM